MGCLSSRPEDDHEVQLPTSKKLKIVLIGIEGSGKTAILQFLKTGKFSHTQPTVGLNVETVNYASKNFLVFDIGGKVRSLWPHYYENLDCLVFVIDSTDKSVLAYVKEEIGKLQTISGSPIECENTLQIDWLLQETNLQQTNSDMVLQRCSAKTGQGIWEGIEKMNKLLDTKQIL